MKKYKLVRCFPGSPPIGTVAIKTHFGYSTGGYGMLFVEDVENYPEFWELIKEPLFITEDRVEIFNGDNYWFVVKSDLEIVKAWIPRLHVCDWDYSGEYKKPPLGHVQFSTEKAAKDWIDLNKPMYSKKQIMDAALVKYITGTILLHIKDIK